MLSKIRVSLIHIKTREDKRKIARGGGIKIDVPVERKEEEIPEDILELVEQRKIGSDLKRKFVR